MPRQFGAGGRIVVDCDTRALLGTDDERATIAWLLEA